MSAKSKRLIWLIVLPFILALVLLLNRSREFSKYVGILTILLSVINAFRVRKNWSLFIIYAFIAYSNYSICLSMYIEMRDIYLNQSFIDEYYIVALNVLLALNVGLTYVQHFVDCDVKKRIPVLSTAKSNNYVFWLFFAVLVVIFFTGIVAPQEGQMRASVSTLYEYSVIIFIVAYFFSKEKLQRIFLTVLLFCYVVQDVIFGGRATALQLMIVFVLLYVQHRISTMKCVPIALIGIVLLTAVGAMRANFSLSLEVLRWAAFLVIDSRLMLDTAYSAYFTSITFIETMSFTSVGKRLDMFGLFLVSMALGGSLVPNSNLSNYTHQFHPHNFGGVLPYYFYFYLGIFGILAIVLYMLFLFRKLYSNKPKSNLAKCIGIYVVAATPRWYLYSPSSLIRGVLLVMVVYFGATVIYKLTTKRVKKTKIVEKAISQKEKNNVIIEQEETK